MMESMPNRLDAADAPDKFIPLFAVAPFRLLFATRLLSQIAVQILGVAVGWQIYDLTGSALDLGLVGLVQFLPPLCLTLPAGQIADQYDRRLVLGCCYFVELAVAVGLLWLALSPGDPIRFIYALLLVNAIARSFDTPALQSLIAASVPRSVLSRAVAASSSANKVATIIGPALGGFLYEIGPDIVYGACAAMLLAALLAISWVRSPPGPAARSKMSWGSMVAGLVYIRRREAILGAISLDLVAVMFGGATALLPIYARDILDLGPVGLGVLRAAPAVGGILIAFYLAHRAINRSAGKIMFASVIVFGVATILFGISRDLTLSLLALAVLGGANMFSVVVRHTLVQVNTPDAMRGRVTAVNSLFTGTSNELGAFESGVTADWFGAVGSVVLGGAATILSVALWAWWFPSLRRVDRLDTPIAEREAT
jgi:MFS family permease